MEIDIEKTKKLLLDWKKAVFESRWCAEEDAVSALGRERDHLRQQLEEAHAALGQLADRVRQLASSYAALAPVIETKNRTSKELQALKEAQQGQEEAHRRAVAEAVGEAEAARTEWRRLVQEAERRGREAECAVRAECAEQLRAAEERLHSERNERAAEQQRHQEHVRDLEQQHDARVQQLQHKVSSLHNAAAQRSAAGGEVYAAKLDGARQEFAVQLADRDSQLCELRRQLQRCEDQLRRQRVLAVVRGEVTPKEGRRVGDGDDAVNVDVCVDRVCGNLNSSANCQVSDDTVGQCAADAALAQQPPPNKRHRSCDYDKVDAGSAAVSCEDTVRDVNCNDADAHRTDDVAPQRQETSVTGPNVVFSLTSVEFTEKSLSRNSLCSEYREATASNAALTPASDHISNGHFLDDTCDEEDMSGLARAWQQTDHTLAEKFRAITKLLAGEKQDAEPKIADENGDSVFTGSEGFIVGNVYDEEYGREDLDKEKDEEPDCRSQASVAAQCRGGEFTLSAAVDGISTEKRVATVRRLSVPIPDSDASATAVTETPRKAWQFSSRNNDSNNRRHFQRDRSVDYRSFVSSAGPCSRSPASECVFDQSEQSASCTCHIPEQSDASVSNLTEDDDLSGGVGVTAQKAWLPHNRTEPAVKSYPTESEPPPDYGELFDNALDSSFPCPRKLAAKMADLSRSSRSIHESDTTSYDMDDIPRRQLQYSDTTLDDRDDMLGRPGFASDTVFCDTLYNSNASNRPLQRNEMTVNSNSADVAGNKKNNKRKLFSGDTFL